MRGHSMRSIPKSASPLRRLAGVAAVVGAVSTPVLVGACSDFLDAENPAAVETAVLEDSSFFDLLANTAINNLQGPIPNLSGTTDFWLTYLGAIFTDELRNHHVFIDESLYDQRRVTTSNSYNNVFTYGPIQRARWLTDSIASRMRIIYPDSSLRDVRLARTYAIAGYHHVQLAEGWCEVPIAPPGQRYGGLVKSDSLFRLAEMRFDSAIKIAAAARAANAPVQTTAGQRFALGADSIRNFAYVGMARAALGRNDKVKAAFAAGKVTAMGAGDFEYRLFHNSNTTSGLQNLWQDRLSGGGGVTSGSISGTPFFALDDARVPHPINATTGAPLTEAVQGTGSFVVPNSPPSHSTFNGTKVGADFNYAGSIRLASLLEARYILAEAEGPTGTNIAFIESRRLAFPSSTAQTPTTAANFLTNLIDQRRRDFYLDGHRMGDLRRYLRLYNLDFYPKGAYLGSATTTYGDVMCWPINTAEITNNPLVPKPYNPPIGP